MMAKISRTFSIDHKIYEKFEDICKSKNINKSKVIQDSIKNFIGENYDIDFNTDYKLKFGDNTEIVKITKKESEFVLLSNGNKMNIFDYYYISDFFISASQREGLSIAYLEAMAFGLPLVSTKTAGTDELLIDGKNGFFIKESSIDATVGSIKKILNSDYFLLRKSALSVAKKYDVNIIIKKYNLLFREMVG